jgi:hypothetical protein
VNNPETFLITMTGVAMLLFATVKKLIIARSYEILRASVNFWNGACCIVNNFCFGHFKHFHNSHFKAFAGGGAGTHEHCDGQGGAAP